MSLPAIENYDLLSIVLHWLVALLVFVLFVSGVWMVELDYYNLWYQLVPWWHRGLGVIAFILVCIRFVFRSFEHKPAPLAS